MDHEYEPKPYIYIGSAFPGSERVQEMAKIVRELNIDVRIGEPDMFTKNSVAADRTVRNRLISGSIGLLLDLRAPTFTVTADRRYADEIGLETLLIDLDPQSHHSAICGFVERKQTQN